jgi:hypothetical protein
MNQLTEIITAFAELPPGHRLEFAVEDGVSLCATVFHDPPNEGWPCDAWFFRSAPGSVWWRSRKYSTMPTPVASVSAGTAEDCARLALDMVRGCKGKLEAWLEKTGAGKR